MGRNPTVWLYFSWLVSFLRSIEPNSGALIITGNLYGIIAIMSGKWILMAVHSIIYTAFTAFAVYILIHFTALSLFNKNGEYTGLHNGQIAQKLQREYRRLWFMLFHYHPQLVKDGAMPPSEQCFHVSCIHICSANNCLFHWPLTTTNITQDKWDK